jgi:hypothetical protein
MTISAEQLSTWSKQGPTAQFIGTYETLQEVLNDRSSSFRKRDFTIFLQGSYKNYTNVYGDSDVDAIIRLNDVFYADLTQLSPEDAAAWNAAQSDATYSLPQFKEEVIAWLIKKYGGDVRSGSKAIYIKGSDSRRNADVLVCAKLRLYHRFKTWQDQRYTEGVCFFRADGTRVDNFPTQHSDNCTKKHQDTKNWFKHTIRIYKNLRNTMIRKKLIENNLAPSYFIEGLLYNAPVEQFGGTEQQNFRDTMDWLNKADRSKFVCANEMYYLFHASSPVTWRAENCNKFLSAAINYWNSA